MATKKKQPARAAVQSRPARKRQSPQRQRQGPPSKKAPASIGTAKQESPQPIAKLVACLVCASEFPKADILILPCQHAHCHDCLERNVATALTSHPFAAARCCSALDPEVVAAHATPVDGMRYKTRVEEAASSDPLYCHATACGAFIPSWQARRSCPTCGLRTCRKCRREGHLGSCGEGWKQDQEHLEHLLKALAAEKKWKQCPWCHQMVEWAGGCRWIFCRCQHTFCAVCGKTNSNHKPYETCLRLEEA